MHDNKTDIAPTVFPFTAVVGQERLQLALLLTAISPEIGGVVIRGEKGTAKTTTVRALSPFLSGRLVDLPLGATEDRVVGSIDVEAVLTTGKTVFNPGLLSAADGGILYVDEVNLLPDHLVDVLLDAAATGKITVERDGISHTEDARFVLVGTMNPEEGELRPQLLDRFGLAVDVIASRDPHTRAEIVSRRLAFDADPQKFASRFEAEQENIATQLHRAQQLLADVELTTPTLGRIATLCADFDVDGMRADIVIARTAVAHAAWRVAGNPDDSLVVCDEDIRVAAELALPHRRRRDPFDEPGLDQQQLDDAMDHASEEFPEEPEAPSHSEEQDAEAPSPSESESVPQEPSGEGEGSTGGSAAVGAPFRRS